MIDPTRDDIGRRVVYRPFPGAVCEEGTITDMNTDYVFVRYGNDTHLSFINISGPTRPY